MSKSEIGMLILLVLAWVNGFCVREVIRKIRELL